MAAPLTDGLWHVDPQRSEIGFAVKEMWGLHTVHGVFAACHGSVEIRPGGVEGRLVIEADSLDTGNDRRDRHLRSPAFFDVERHPQITFTATALSPREEGLTIVGELTIASSHLKVELPMNLEQSTDGERRLAGHTTISRRAAGLAWNVLGMIRGDASVHARLALERASSTS